MAGRTRHRGISVIPLNHKGISFHNMAIASMNGRFEWFKR